MGSAVRYVAPTLSYHKVGEWQRNSSNSLSNDWIHVSSNVVLAMVQYSTSVFELETVGCLREL